MTFLKIFVSQQLLFLFSKHLDTMSNATDCGTGRIDLWPLAISVYLLYLLQLEANLEDEEAVDDSEVEVKIRKKQIRQRQTLLNSHLVVHHHQKPLPPSNSSTQYSYKPALSPITDLTYENSSTATLRPLSPNLSSTASTAASTTLEAANTLVGQTSLETDSSRTMLNNLADDITITSSTTLDHTLDFESCVSRTLDLESPLDQSRTLVLNDTFDDSEIMSDCFESFSVE